jgi:hypothetical protein
MRIIKLTSLHDKAPIYINSIDVIGHIYEVKEEDFKYGKIEKAKHTRIGANT